jgi:folylpolyglutamate synthase/dihydropteroate synthase
MMRVVKEDFVLGSDHAHYALMGATTDEDRKGIWEYLRPRNTMPVFYQVPEVQEEQAQDHSDLKRLVSELAAEVGVTSVSDGIASVTRRMLEL